MTDPETFEQFWDFYLDQHRDRRSRALHYAGTSLAVSAAALSLATANPVFLLAAPILAYSTAWTGHFVFEKNRPATLKYPLWSLRGDFRMLGCALRGKISSEFERVKRVGAHRAPASASRPNAGKDPGAAGDWPQGSDASSAGAALNRPAYGVA